MMPNASEARGKLLRNAVPLFILSVAPSWSSTNTDEAHDITASPSLERAASRGVTA